MMFENIKNEVWAGICTVLATLFVVASLTAWAFAHEAHGLQSQLDSMAGARAEANKTATKDFNEATKTIVETRVEYRTKTVEIEKYIGDDNATQCEQNGDFYHDTRYLR
jgi:CHASE1-domain containing sensor protein